MRFKRILLGFCSLWTLAGVPAAVSAETAASPSGTSTIPFKTEPPPIETYGPRVVLVLAALAGIALTGIYVLRKRLPGPIRGPLSGKRIRVVERVHLNARCTLFLVYFHNREMLIGQCGDNLVEFSSSPSDAKDV